MVVWGQGKEGTESRTAAAVGEAAGGQSHGEEKGAAGRQGAGDEARGPGCKSLGDLCLCTPCWVYQLRPGCTVKGSGSSHLAV